MTSGQITKDPTTELLDAIVHIRPVIETHAAQGDTDRKLPRAVFEALFDAGLYAMNAPRAYGGFELSPSEMMRVWEAVARIDAATAWNLAMNQGFMSFVGWLPDEGARELLGEGPAPMAGGFFPPGTAVRADGGWRVTARVPFVSGCHDSRWFWLPALETTGGEPVVDPGSGAPNVYAFFVPRDEAEIFDTWHTVGMRGTGSADVGVSDLFVPDRRALQVGPLTNPAPGFEGPLYRMYPMSSVLGEATVSLGVAAAAVDALTGLAKTKMPAFTTTALRDQPLAQHLAGRAAARVNASRDTLHAAARQAYDEVESSGKHLSWDAKIKLQSAVTFGAESCAEAVRLVNEAAGSSAIRSEYPFERYFRDAHVLTQHASKSSPRYATVGKLLFGLENDWTALDF